MTVYWGNSKIKDVREHGIYYGNAPINSIYYGSQCVYQYIPQSMIFGANVDLQTYKVPKGCKRLQVDCVAARGYQGRQAGAGGRVQCILLVTPEQTLYIAAGLDPTGQSAYTYNASDIRTNNAGLTDETSLKSRLVVAGGGGYASAGATYGAAGGNGGGLTGAAGGTATYGGGGGGGTQTAGGGGGSYSGSGGGLPGWNGGTGQFGLGGISNDWTQSGGSGWYGGGGGGAAAYFGDGRGGGGGGSSYTHPDLCTDVIHTQGYNAGAGYITITPIK